MKETGWYIFFGFIAAVLAGIMIWPDEANYTIDAIGDFMYNLTTSQQAKIAQLQPDVQTQLQTLILALQQQGLDVYVGETLRTQAQEQAAIDSGHSAVKTHSWHELGRAVDLYPINPDTGKADLDGVRDDLFRQMHETAASLGWYGLAYSPYPSGPRHTIITANGRKIWDGGHLQWMAPYSSIADAVAAEGAQYGIA